MLSLMRRHAKSWFIKIALGLVAVVFIFWGVGAYSAKERGRLAVVNGEPITLVDYNKAYRDMVDSARRTFGDALNEDLIKRLNIRSQALERLISEKLAIQAAQDAGVAINDEVLREIIRSYPAFQENGQFSTRLYQRVLAANGFDPASFEAAQRKELILARLRSRPEFLAQASGPEARVFFHWQRDEIKVSFVAFDPLSFESQVKVEEPALAAFFKENQEGYRVSEKVEAAYLAFRPETYLGQVKIDPEELREYYEITQAGYREPERIKLRDILLPFPATADQADMDKVKAEAEKAAAEAKSGTDFLALAKKYAPKAEQPKELSWLSRDQLAPELAEAAFKLNPGETGGPARSQLGFHVLKVEEKQAARLKTFDEVKDEVEKRRREDKAKELALEAAETAYGQSAEVKSLAALAAKLGQKAESAGPFSRQDPPAGPFSEPRLLEAAFSQEENELGPAVELPEGYFLVQVLKKIPSFLPEFKDVAPAVRQDYVREEAKKLAKKAAEDFLAQAKGGEWLKVCQAAKVQTELPKPFTRRAQIEGLGFDQALNEAAFRLTAKKPLPDKVFETAGKFVVLHFEDRLKASEEVFQKNVKELTEAIRNQRQQELLGAWMTELRQRAKVKVDKELL